MGIPIAFGRLNQDVKSPVEADSPAHGETNLSPRCTGML